PIAMVRAHGHGLWRVEAKGDGRAVGICGLLRRASVEDPDVGFGFLPAARGLGYATEAARETVELGRRRFGWTRIAGFTSPANHASARVLEKVGLRYEGRTRLPDGDDVLHRFAWDATAPGVRLRPVEDDDVPRFFEHQLDPASHRAAAFTVANPSDRGAFEARWRRLRADAAVRAFTVLAEGAVAGHVARFERDGAPEVTVWIDRGHAGAGVGTAALGSLLHREIERPLHARVAADHVASLRVLEKCGFSVVGRDRAFAPARGTEIDELLLTLES
ncbi:MAG: GNAT family N-acetyltransferase, partial [Planctomycetota bacterium JB042]